MLHELQKILEDIKARVETLLPVLGLPEKKQQLLELEEAMQQPDFWHDQMAAQGVSQKYNVLKEFVSFWVLFPKELEELDGLVAATDAADTEGVAYLQTQVETARTKLNCQESLALLSQQYDDHSAIVAIHAGAGGTDAQDWAEMLLRMYMRYAEAHGFAVDILEKSRGNEAGIKSVLFEVTGPFAYGYLRGEAGVHRLVRLSPFNPSHTRETSFALVEVLPALAEAESVKLDPKDLKIEANTASGHGGQSVNTTYSAIRITHIPTGIRVSIQNERSQHQNREVALKILASRLQVLEDEKFKAEKKELRGEFKSAEWGNQIRSYVLHPYKLVKDHRTNCESSDAEGVLDGNIDEFIEKYLEFVASSR